MGSKALARCAQPARPPRRRLLGAGLLAFAAPGVMRAAQPPVITVASTTSTEQSGLFGHLLPAFRAAAGIEVRVVAVGTGQALDIGRRGDADVLLVHDRDAELEFVAGGFGIERRDVMYNDFVLVGPRSDPARVDGLRDVAAALRAIAQARLPFVSRGDRSGTHAAELRSWRQAGVDPAAGRGAWYREVGQGMGAALNVAAASGAYVLSDRGTWISFRNRGALSVLVQGDPALFNQYGVMLVDPVRHPHVRREPGMRFIDWLTSPDGQRTIADYRIDGQQLFFPNYRRPQATDISHPIMPPQSIQRLSDTFATAPQLRPEDLAAVAAAGFRSIVNNRPDHEGGPDQPTDAQMREAAQQAGLAYAFQPVVASQLSPADAARLAELLRTLPAPVLAYCRTGTRSRRLFEAVSQGAPDRPA